MDALTHAIEAYVSTLNSPFTDPFAVKAIETVFDYLPQSYLGDMDAREQTAKLFKCTFHGTEVDF